MPTPTPIESPSAQPEAPPATISVAFSGLQRGVYPTHLHSRCSGLQAYHLIVLQSLVIGPDGAGSVAVSSSYFGRGYCVIVYSSPSLATVAATRQI